MDFALTDEQREIQSLAREFADAEIAPHAADWDREHRFPREVFAKLGELGLMGVCVPDELGGAVRTSCPTSSSSRSCRVRTPAWG